MALFGRSEEKAARDEAAQAEAERLQALSAVELAEELMPAFGPDGPKPGKFINDLQVGAWLMSSYARGSNHLKELHEPIREGLQALENAGLVEGRSRGGAAVLAKATRLGEQALTEGTVASHLQG